MERFGGNHGHRGHVRWRIVVAVLACTGLTGALLPGKSEFRLVGVMHENLAAVNRIVEAVTRDDYPGIQEGAAHLKASAEKLRGIDLAGLGLDPGRAPAFDRHLAAQIDASRRMAAAATGGELASVLIGMQQLLDEACVSCHQEFRADNAARTPQVLFMRNLLSSVQSMNRGVALDDFALIAREAREIGGLAHVFSWSQVVESLFGIGEPAQREEFRGYVERLSAAAIEVERAALDRSPRAINRAARHMLEEGCVPCHARFRETQDEG